MAAKQAGAKADHPSGIPLAHGRSVNLSDKITSENESKDLVLGKNSRVNEPEILAEILVKILV